MGDNMFQSEISRRREHEVQKLKKDLELILIERETSETSLKKRYQETINDLTDQLEQLNRQRNKYEHSPRFTAPSLALSLSRTGEGARDCTQSR